MIKPQSHHWCTSHGDGAMGKSCVTDLRVAGSNPLGEHRFFSKSKILQRFSVLTKNLDIPVKFLGPGSRLSCADRGVASPWLLLLLSTNDCS